MKILMDEHDKVTKELKKQNTQLLKQNEQLRKKRKPDIELLASPDSPPEEDSTLLEIEFPQQCADDADKRADEARARVIEAERRAEEAEKHAKEARLGAESRVAKLEKELDGRDVQVQVSYCFGRASYACTCMCTMCCVNHVLSGHEYSFIPVTVSIVCVYSVDRKQLS